MYETYKHKTFFKILILLTSVIELPFCATYFGWPPLVYIFKAEGYFSDIESCSQNVTQIQNSNISDLTCQDQKDFIFATLYQTSDILQVATALLSGIFFDKYGSQKMRHLCTIFLSLGSLNGWLLVKPGYKNFYQNQWLLYTTMVCIGLGCVPLFITNMQMGFLFAKHSEAVMAFFNGMFDTGDGVTIIPKILWQKYGLGVNFWFMIMFLVNFVILARTVFLFPKMFVEKEEFLNVERKESDTTDIDITKEEQVALKGDQTSEKLKPSELPKISSKQIYNWFLMPEFFFFIPWLTFINLNLNFFHQNLNAWLTEISDNDDTFVSNMTDLFSYIQPIAIVFSQVGGLVLRWFGVCLCLFLDIIYYTTQIAWCIMIKNLHSIKILNEVSQNVFNHIKKT